MRDELAALSALETACTTACKRWHVEQERGSGASSPGLSQEFGGDARAALSRRPAVPVHHRTGGLASAAHELRRALQSESARRPSAAG